jgi:hypothetical protein
MPVSPVGSDSMFLPQIDNSRLPPDDRYHLETAPRGCTGDEGGPLGAGLQDQASNHLKRLWSKGRVVSVKEKSRLRLWQVRIREMNVSEPLMRRRNELDGVKTGGFQDARMSPGGTYVLPGRRPA